MSTCGISDGRVHPSPKSESPIARQRTILANQTALGQRLDPPVGARTVKEYVASGMPGLPGQWCLEDCQAWVDENIRHRGEKRPRSAKPDADLFLNEPSSPALERYRRHRASMALLDLRQRRGELLPREKVHELLGRLSAIIRSAGEALQRQCGADAARLLEDALDEADAEIDRFIRNARAHRTRD